MNKRYFLTRLILIPITLFGIMVLNFVITQAAPGGPVEQVMSRLTAETQGKPGEIRIKENGSSAVYRGGTGLSEEIRQELIQQFGFDKPPLSRFIGMIKSYLQFDFGKSFYQDKTVIQLILEKMPVSISLGVFSTLFIYLISIPLGIKKALLNKTPFDTTTTFILTVCYAVPAFVLALFLLIVFAGGQYLHWFPLKGLTSYNWETFSLGHKITDYLWHMILPTLAMGIGGLAGLTFLTKNSFLEEIHKTYVLAAKAKGLSLNSILYKHIFRNAMLIVIAGFPSLFISLFFTGSVLIEVMFSLDGLGLLGYESILNRDYPVIFGTLYLFGLIGLILNLISDFVYTLIDPRITFNQRKR